jgi:transcriptional repressor NrdR
VRCPFCHQDDDRVIDSRSTDDDTAIRRRRECKACGQRFTTYERVENEEQIRVIKRDGSRQSFDRRKLMAGLTVACEKRPVSASDLEALVNRLQSQLQADSRREIPASEIGQMVMEKLHNLDQVAYVRFASVYRQFKDVDQFLEEVHRVQDRVQEGGAGG